MPGIFLLQLLGFLILLGVIGDIMYLVSTKQWISAAVMIILTVLVFLEKEKTC